MMLSLHGIRYKKLEDLFTQYKKKTTIFEKENDDEPYDWYNHVEFIVGQCSFFLTRTNAKGSIRLSKPSRNTHTIEYLFDRIKEGHSLYTEPDPTTAEEAVEWAIETMQNKIDKTD